MPPRSIGIWKSPRTSSRKEWIATARQREVYDEYIMSGAGSTSPAFVKLARPSRPQDRSQARRAQGRRGQYHTYGCPRPPPDKVQLITNSFILPQHDRQGSERHLGTKDAIAWARRDEEVMAARRLFRSVPCLAGRNVSLRAPAFAGAIVRLLARTEGPSPATSSGSPLRRGEGVGRGGPPSESLRQGSVSWPPSPSDRGAWTARRGPGPLRRTWASFATTEINWTSTPAGKRALRVIGEFRGASPATCASHYIFQQAASAGPAALGRRQRLPRGRRRPPLLRFPPSPIACTTPWSGRPAALVSSPSPRASCPNDAEARFPLRAEPDAWSPYEQGSGRSLPRTTRKWAGSSVGPCRALRRPLPAYVRAAVGAGKRAGFLYWRGTRRSSTRSTTRRRAAMKAGAAEAAVGGPTTTGRSRPRETGTNSSVGSRPLREDLRASRLRLLSHQGGALRSVAGLRTAGRPAPRKQSPSSLKNAARGAGGLDAVAVHPRFAIFRASWTSATPRCPRNWGVSTNANFRLPETANTFPVFQCKLMKKLWTDVTGAGAHVDQATTWRF